MDLVSAPNLERRERLHDLVAMAWMAGAKPRGFVREALGRRQWRSGSVTATILEPDVLAKDVAIEKGEQLRRRRVVAQQPHLAGGIALNPRAMQQAPAEIAEQSGTALARCDVGERLRRDAMQQIERVAAGEVDGGDGDVRGQRMHIAFRETCREPWRRVTKYIPAGRARAMRAC